MTSFADLPSDEQDVFAAVQSFATVAGVFARDLVKGVAWATHGSDRRLDKALQSLKRRGLIEYVKGSGWTVVKVRS